MTPWRKWLAIITWVSIWNQSLLDALFDLEWDCSSVSVLAVSACRRLSLFCTNFPMKDPLSNSGYHYNAQTCSWMLQHHGSVPPQMSPWVPIWNKSFPNTLSHLVWAFPLCLSLLNLVVGDSSITAPHPQWWISRVLIWNIAMPKLALEHFKIVTALRKCIVGIPFETNLF